MANRRGWAKRYGPVCWEYTIWTSHQSAPSVGFGSKSRPPTPRAYTSSRVGGGGGGGVLKADFDIRLQGQIHDLL